MCANNWLEESCRFYQRAVESPSVERRKKGVCVTDADKLYISYHHLSELGKIFEKRFTCCNLFKTHKRYKAIKFHYSWQSNFLITDMIVSLVGI